MKATEYLTAVKTKLNLSSDYKLAKALALPPSLVSKYMAGKNVPGPLVAFKVAEILGDQPAAVIADFELERAEKAEKADDSEEWKKVIRRIGGTAATILVALGIGGIPNADARLASSAKDYQSIHRINKIPGAQVRSGLQRNCTRDVCGILGKHLTTSSLCRESAHPHNVRDDPCGHVDHGRRTGLLGLSQVAGSQELVVVLAAAGRGLRPV